MNTHRSLRPDPRASELANHMASAEAVHTTILEETIASGERGQMTESGRTACSDASNTRTPLGRFPRAVELEKCPAHQVSGAWHTHVTPDQLRNPALSMPDMANVLLEGMDVFAVVGTQSSQFLVAPDDREAGVLAMQNVLGLEVTTTRDVVVAMLSRMIQDPEAAHSRMQSTVSPLLFRTSNSFPGLDSRVSQLNTATVGVTASQGAQGFPGVESAAAYQGLVSPDLAGLRGQAREGSEFLRFLSRRFLDDVLGALTAQAATRLLFG